MTFSVLVAVVLGVLGVVAAIQSFRSWRHVRHLMRDRRLYEVYRRGESPPDVSTRVIRAVASAAGNPLAAAQESETRQVLERFLWLREEAGRARALLSEGSEERVLVGLETLSALGGMEDVDAVRWTLRRWGAKSRVGVQAARVLKLLEEEALARS